MGRQSARGYNHAEVAVRGVEGVRVFLGFFL